LPEEGLGLAVAVAEAAELDLLAVHGAGLGEETRLAGVDLLGEQSGME
jgi:hypothetical protein